MNRIIIEEFRNAFSLNAENTSFDVEINHPDYGWIPYTIYPDDTDTNINNVDLLSLIGDSYSAYVAPTKSHGDFLAERDGRDLRDLYLKTQVDPIAGNILRWNNLTDVQRAAWTQYRVDLLNVPQQEGFPHDVTWPTEPE